LSMDLAEEQIRAGTVSAQVLAHFVKLGSTAQKLEMEKLTRENELLTAKTKSLKDSKQIDALYREALNAMKLYSGNANPSPSDED